MGKSISWVGGTPHTLMMEQRVGTPHIIERTKSRRWVGEWVGGLVKFDFRTHSGSHQSTAWIQNISSSRVWQLTDGKKINRSKVGSAHHKLDKPIKKRYHIKRDHIYIKIINRSNLKSPINTALSIDHKLEQQING